MQVRSHIGSSNQTYTKTCTYAHTHAFTCYTFPIYLVKETGTNGSGWLKTAGINTAYLCSAFPMTPPSITRIENKSSHFPLSLPFYYKIYVITWDYVILKFWHFHLRWESANCLPLGFIWSVWNWFWSNELDLNSLDTFLVIMSCAIRQLLVDCGSLGIWVCDNFQETAHTLNPDRWETSLLNWKRCFKWKSGGLLRLLSLLSVSASLKAQGPESLRWERKSVNKEQLWYTLTDIWICNLPF